MESSRCLKFLWNFLDMDVMIIIKHHNHKTIQLKIIKLYHYISEDCKLHILLSLKFSFYFQLC